MMHELIQLKDFHEYYRMQTQKFYFIKKNSYPSLPAVMFCK